MTKTEAAIPENVLTWARLAGWNEQEIMSTTIEERLVRFTEIVISAARDECIDVVARNGGSVEIERAIRNLRSYGMAHTSSLGADAPVGLPAGETTGPVASAPTPVAWMWRYTIGGKWQLSSVNPAEWKQGGVEVRGLYDHPPQREPLTWMQAVMLWGHRSDGPSTSEIVEYARAVERAHGIGDKHE